MNPTPQPSRLEKLHDRLSQSKYWSISLAVHAVALAALSTIVLVQSTPDEDIPFVGGDVPETDMPRPLLNNEPERPPEIVIQETTPQLKKPLETQLPPYAQQVPTVTASIPTTFVMPTAVAKAEDPVFDIKDIAKAPSHVPKVMGIRFNKDSRGYVQMSGGPGKPPTPTTQSEQAVLKGLKWLRDNQNDDGSWGLRNKAAMTGLALLSFLGHGELGDSPEFGLSVNKAIKWVRDNGTKYQSRLSMTDGDWGPGNGGVYEHGILTYALAEYYTLTQDPMVVELLRGAIGHIVKGQGPDGGWMYNYDKTQSDTSVSGWQVQALKAAHLTKLDIPGVDAALDLAMRNFDRVQGEKGYGYRTPGDRYSLTGVGVACELFWRDRRDNNTRKAIEFILDQAKSEPVKYDHEKADLYAWYYHTQAMLMYGGAAWLRWEPQFREMAVKSQAHDGSWPVMKAPAHGNLQNDATVTGGVYRTSLNILMLEAYYRYLPSNQGNNTPAEPMRFASR